MLRYLLLAATLVGSALGDATYADDFARNKMWPAAASAYSSKPEKCFDNKFQNATLYKRYDIRCDALHLDTCCGLAIAAHGDKAIVLVFRGTTSFLQLIEEADKSVLNKHVEWAAGGKVSKYFNDAFFDIWNGGMKDGFNTLKAQYPDYAVWVTGHSLGGAMATLGGSYLIKNNLADPSTMKLVTFGEPRVGNKAFAEAHDKQLDYHFRVTHSRDIVPHIPEEIFEYHQHKFEVFYHDNMKPGAKYKVCKEDEDMGCSNGLLLDTSVPDHLKYFDHDCLLYGDDGCK
jgi:hypothetical protein